MQRCETLRAFDTKARGLQEYGTARSHDGLRERANDLLAAVRKGLTEGTTPEDDVVAGYERRALQFNPPPPRRTR